MLATARQAPAGAVSGIVITVQQISGAIGIAAIGALYFAVVPDRAGFLVVMLPQLAVVATAFLCLRRMSAVDLCHSDVDDWTRHQRIAEGGET